MYIHSCVKFTSVHAKFVIQVRGIGTPMVKFGTPMVKNSVPMVIYCVPTEVHKVKFVV